MLYCVVHPIIVALLPSRGIRLPRAVALHHACCIVASCLAAVLSVVDEKPSAACWWALVMRWPGAYLARLRGKRVTWLRVAVECTLPALYWSHRGLPGMRTIAACHMVVAAIVYMHVATAARSHAARLLVTGSFTAHYMACLLVCVHQGHWLFLCYMSSVACAFAASNAYAAP